MMAEELGFILTVEEIIPRMIEGERIWEIIYDYVVTIMTRKETEHREAENRKKNRRKEKKTQQERPYRVTHLMYG